MYYGIDSILGFRIAPPVVGRRLNLTQLKPVTTTGLQATYLMKGMKFINLSTNDDWDSPEYMTLYCVYTMSCIIHQTYALIFVQMSHFLQKAICVSMVNVTTVSHLRQPVQRVMSWRAPSLSGYPTGTSSPPRDTHTRGRTGTGSKRAGRQTLPTARDSWSSHRQNTTMEY